MQTPSSTRPAPRWMSRVLVAAGIYNLLWGAWAILLPASAFRLAGMDPPNHLFLWQCIGMIVGVYGVGYLAAARDPARHWPIVLVGLLGKILGPIGFVDAFLRGSVTPAFGVNIIFNDLLWWVPFSMILWHAVSEAQRPAEPGVLPVEDAIRAARVHAPGGESSLAEYTRAQPALVVFLRHLGCTFCREAMVDLAAQRPAIEAAGTRIVLVHMSPPAEGEAYFAAAGLAGVAHVSDPACGLYRSFGLRRGTFWQLFGPATWFQGLRAVRHGVGGLKGDGLQMPGVFHVEHSRIVREFRHRSAGDRPDYRELAACPVGARAA